MSLHRIPSTHSRRLRAAAALLVSSAILLCAPELGAQEHTHAAHGPKAHDHAPKERRVALLPGLGTWHMAVTTRSARAQQFFDQGLRLAYAFNHAEAERAFTEAARLDPACAMCQWGVAYAAGPNINLPVSPEAETRAAAAITQAVKLAANATPVERALIAALAERVKLPAGANRAGRDSAYARAMRETLTRWPKDADVQTLFADAAMNLRPWKYWTPEGEPHVGTLELVSVLENAIASSPTHAGACHFYVHAVEASNTPERALACADRLPKLMPGAGHLVHMPAHIYLRVGRYADAARANVAAVATDKQYLQRPGVPVGPYSMFYAPHNTHFLWTAYLFSGQRERALTAARTLEQTVAPTLAAAIPSLESFLATPVLTLARFGMWDAVLMEPAPAREFRYWSGMWHHARGLAFLAKGDLAAASAQLDTLRSVAATTPDSIVIINNPARVVLELASDVLAGELALREGKVDAGLALLRTTVKRETALVYDEPPAWYHSTRNRLGLALLSAGKAAEAEAVFRDDLRVYRENGWSLAGLERALRAQGKDEEASAVATRFAAAWREADTKAIAAR